MNHPRLTTQQSTEAAQLAAGTYDGAKGSRANFAPGRAIFVHADASYGLYFAGDPNTEVVLPLAAGHYDYSIVNVSSASGDKVTVLH